MGKVVRRLDWMRRGRAWKQEIERATRGDVPFAAFPEVAPDSPLEIRRGRELPDGQLARLLGEDELGTWALDGATLGFLKHLLGQDRPRAIVEFGAGSSTLAFAWLLHQLHGDCETRLFSIEQNEWAANNAKERLDKAGLGQVGQVFLAPLQPVDVEGVRVPCYSLDEGAKKRLRENKIPFDWVLVDGPAGDDLVRFGTLPLVREWVAREARWFLDDARRDEERVVLERWARLPFLRVEGTFGVGKGLACGRFVAP